MRRNCNLDLQILSSNTTSSPSTSVARRCQLGAGSNQDDQKAIFYSTDATELQAIAILWLARRKIEEKYDDSLSKNSSPDPTSLIKMEMHGRRGLSLKKSLQKFLQKRKDRVQAASMPY